MLRDYFYRHLGTVTSRKYYVPLEIAHCDISQMLTEIFLSNLLKKRCNAEIPISCSIYYWILVIGGGGDGVVKLRCCCCFYYYC